jgi:putative peptide zinc metalloprotease protein
MPDENRSVREIEMLRPRLRDGLRFAVQEIGGRPGCVIEDPFASRFHRVGLPEYRFLRALDGTRTVATILAQLARDGSGEAFTEAEALQMIRWLKDQNLLALESTRATSEREENARALGTAVTWLNPLVLKIPLARPDAFFTRIEPAFGWALGGFGFLVWLLVVAFGVMQVGMDWTRFQGGFDGILSRSNWLWLFIAWAGLKTAHEFGHGLFCKHFGAAVREVGVIFVLFVPMGYVDATASLGLASKWRRIMVSCAGLYVEFFLAALAAVVWAHTGPGPLNTLAHNVVVTGTVVTLFFNANPLMRFDGYFILSDLLDLPNLAPRGRAWMQRALTWLLLGGRPRRPSALRTREDWLVAIYGAAAQVWQVVVLVGLLAGASAALRGGGLLLAALAAVTWIALPVGKFFGSLVTSGGSGHWLRVGTRVALLAGLLALVLFLPFHRSVTSAGVVELADTQTLRAECPGFISKIHVQDGETVAEGQLLLELANNEAQATLEKSRIDLEQQELRARLAYQRGAVAEFQAEQAKAESLRTTVKEHESYVATLQIRAPMAGRVTGRQLALMQGAFAEAGSELCRIGRGSGSDVRMAVAQADEPHLRAAVEHPLHVKIEGRSGVLDATLKRVEARATRELIHPALTAMAGGPLALRRSEEAGTAGSPTSRGPEYELAEPFFAATARLTTTEPLGIGETARVKFRSPRAVTLWGELQRAFAHWLKRYSAT